MRVVAADSGLQGPREGGAPPRVPYGAGSSPPEPPGGPGRALVPSHRPRKRDNFNPFSRFTVTTHPAGLKKLPPCELTTNGHPKNFPEKLGDF